MPTNTPASSTDVARLRLSAGPLDALRAVHFVRRFPPHFHDTFAIGVVESGSTRLLTHRGEWIARAGSILAFSPGEIHAAEALTEQGYAYRMVYPSRELLGEIVRRRLASTVAPAFRAPVIHDDDLARRLLHAHEPLMRAGGDDPRSESLLVAALRTLHERHAGRGRESPARMMDLEMVERAREVLEARFAEAVRLSSVAEECGVGPFRLIRVFQRVVGLPPYAYLLQVRINRAQRMLCLGQRVADVAYSCGFADQSHFTRVFRRVVGVPPGQYVRQVRSPAAWPPSRSF